MVSSGGARQNFWEHWGSGGFSSGIALVILRAQGLVLG